MLGKGLESLIPPRKQPSDAASPNDEGAGNIQKPEPSQTGSSDRAADAAEMPPLPLGDLSRPEEAAVLPEHVFRDKKQYMRRGAIEGNAIFHIETEKIYPNPHQPRRDFNADALKDLADSIREFGIIQPLVVTKTEKEVPGGTEVAYELIAGERRLMAAKLAGLERVPVIVRAVDAERERLEMAIIENLQRENLNPIETARAFARLQDEFRLTQREIATQLGKSREVVANTLRLLDLPSYIQDALGTGQISESHGRLLLAVSDSRAQEALFRDLVDKHMSTRELKDRVWRLKSPKQKEQASGLTPELLMLEERLTSEFGTPVKIETQGETGKITITFYSAEELQHIVEKLAKEEEI